ncbi:hypothetical protein PP744_gp009 [Rhizobium phage RHph_N38]|uniref:Uncharacterized protein n=1 Tax=Rhizobium phage RHph_N38 TaxID=2509750 RepID=A0A7S5R3E9_9CAUD|nr:hypothetical protein PP744_gp009 [Rhizobium phage RHph_N38]QIG70472.1 hypothetical protein EVB89_009 [Rhizobium phage RHph_N38]
MGTKDDYTTHSEARQALFELQRYARDLGVSLESVIQSLIREDMQEEEARRKILYARVV